MEDAVNVADGGRRTMSCEVVPISATVTAYDRRDQTLATIERILACRPAPDELLVHVDAGQDALADSIKANFPGVSVIVSARAVGPGGGRNKLMAQARNELIANFDDDSYPIDLDYFARAAAIFEMRPSASAIGAAVFHANETIEPSRREVAPASSFVGCGVVFRRSDFMDAGGYLPLPIAYGAEEEDISLRLFDRGKSIYFSPSLRVFHNTMLTHHSEPEINAHAIANVALLAYLRYPKRCFALGIAQVGSRILWCVRAGRFRGLGQGIALIPMKLWSFRSQRAPVSHAALQAKRNVRDSQSATF